MSLSPCYRPLVCLIGIDNRFPSSILIRNCNFINNNPLSIPSYAFEKSTNTAIACPIGPEHNLLQPAPEQCQRLWLTSPILTIDDMEVLKLLSTKQLRSKVINITYSSKVGTSGLENTLKRVINDCAKAVRSNFNMLILSDRSVGPSLVPISALLAVGAAHQHLVNEHLRMKTALLVESGEVRDIHHFAVLLGFGADAICPYMVMQLIVKYQKLRVFHMDASDEQLFDRYRATCLNGLFHIMAKMGISTLQSFKGAQCFECVGLAEEVVEMCFTGTTSRIGGVGFEILASEVHQRHVVAYSDRVCDIKFAQNYGFIDWRAGGEYHLYSPQSIDLLSRAIHTNNLEVYRKFSCLHNELTKHCTLSGQLDFVYSNNPISLNEVESKACILKRFAAAAISFGSVSIEAYNSIVRAMKTLKCSSNCGEGGIPAGGEEATIKQIASGRFGVDLKYIVNAKELQIKIGQGSKPGEGGELPWYKMDKVVAETRRSMPLTGDRSPAPHHDVYSVEDLSQLVYDLRSANPTCIISLKLVSSVGVGVVATGAVKTGVKHVTISGHGGGTGGSNRTGIKNAGMPWELGIAESHQVLVLNNIRKKVTLEVDGQLQNGYDIVKAALLGADSFSFGTCVMIALGCTMCKKCHLNTCHVGIATQDKQLRKRFQGKEQSIVNYFNFIADEVRHIMAALGIRFFHELNGRTDLLVKRNDLNYKAQTLDFSLMLTPNLEIEKSSIQQHFVTFDEASKLEFQYVSRLSEFIVSNKWRQHKSLMLESKIGNIDRTFGTTLSGHVCRLIENLEEFPDNSIIIRLYGTAGQSLGAFLSKGLTLLLDGDANDFVGKGLSGGTIVVKPNSTDFKSQENTIAGNVLLYGATSGKAFFRGLVGERFCVRNSGAIAVCEGCGDHGCEYMTAGTAIILGSIGRNFAAGLAGGVAYVYDKFNNLSSFCNTHAVEISKLKDCNEIDKLKSIIQEFYEHTQSEVAWEILNAWSENIFRFIKLSAVVSLNHFDTVNDYRSLSRSSLISIQSEPSIDLDVIPDLEDIVNEKHKGFLLYEREKLAYRNVRERITDKDEIVNLFALKSGIKKQASRCINCGVPFCQSEFGCPVGCVISDFNKLVTEDDWKSALQRILQSNNFPEFTGRVCPAFCESACVLQPDPVTIRNVELVIAEHGFINNWIIPEIPSHRTGYRVSIVGSGPAGLAAASQLNKAGHDVVIYEQEAEVGGLLRYGIPPTRLNRKIIDRRINIMQREGVKLLVNYKIDDAKLLDLLSLSDSVVIAVGSSWPKELKVDGRYLENVFLASAFMNIWLTKGKPTIDVTDKRIVVIGQADCATTADCISMLVRENVKSVKCILLVSQCTQERHLSTVSSQCELNVAREEILEFCDFSSDQTEYSPKILCFLGNHNGDVRAVQFLSYKPTDAQPCGDHVDNPSNGYEQKTVECDMVMVSIGIDNYHDDNVRRLKRDIKFNKDKYSNDKINDYKTNIPDLFICGDCRIGSSAVVHAIAEGRRAARLVDLHLMGESHLAGTGGIVTDIYR
ncbi:hypothetical protein GJ496_003864 [Pomphorhynchus laevis]|nr:hypothetical protein GJ496_003864 [Pomphorhynchus laevis]